MSNTSFEAILGPTPRVCDLVKENKMRRPTVMQHIKEGRLRASKLRGAWRTTPEDWKTYVRGLWFEGLNVKEEMKEAA